MKRVIPPATINKLKMKPYKLKRDEILKGIIMILIRLKTPKPSEKSPILVRILMIRLEGGFT
ncbi:MAG: hypothetical protein ACTSPV_17365, partial [Candidatus Hodarchaeales archaeon]